MALLMAAVSLVEPLPVAPKAVTLITVVCLEHPPQILTNNRITNTAPRRFTVPSPAFLPPVTTGLVQTEMLLRPRAQPFEPVRNGPACSLRNIKTFLILAVVSHSAYKPC